MNKGDWFALDSVYRSAPKDSIWDFLEVYSRCLIGNRLNRPDVSIPAFAELFNTQSANLDLGNMLNSSVMFAMDLSRTGDNATAASMLTSILDATREHLDSAAIAGMQKYVDQYSALSAYKPYGISFSSPVTSIPFRYMPVGPAKYGSLLMRIDDCTINGMPASMTFDTGAGVNIISDSLAAEYGLIPLDASQKVGGMGIQGGRLAIAKELKLGGMTITDVPFTVLTITANNEEADRYMDCLDLVIGSELMLQLKDVTIDFTNRRIEIPSTPPSRSDNPLSNICFSSQMNLLAKGYVHGSPMLMNIDTGNASFGELDKKFFEDNREFVTSRAQPDSIRMAGIGGVHISKCYRIPDLVATLGGNSVTVPEMTVRLQGNPIGMDYECNLGLRSLMLFDKIRFNMEDFTLSTFPSPSSSNSAPN